MPSTILRIVIQGSFAGQVCENVMHFKAVDETGLTLNDFAIDIRDFWLPQIRTRIMSGFVWQNIFVTQIDPAGPATVTLPVNITGTLSTVTSTTPFECLVVQIKTALAGRHGHGRFYLTGVPSADHSFGLLTASAITSWTTVLNTLNTRYNISGPSPLVYGVIRRGGTFGDFVNGTSLVIRTSLGAQRRRNYGVGI
jgi:hypothetical protein